MSDYLSSTSKNAKSTISDESLTLINKVYANNEIDEHSIHQFLTKEAWKQGFLSLMRDLAAKTPNSPDIGFASRCYDEVFRVGQKASLSFSPSEIDSITLKNNQLKIKLNSLGMLGHNGPLPLHFTEILRERETGKRDETLSNFIDIFHHRFATLFYRAWSQSQSVVSLDRENNANFSNYVSRILGDEPAELKSLPLPLHARLSSAPHRVRHARNPDGLVATIQNYFKVPVQLHEFTPSWIELETNDKTCLGQLSDSSILGQGAVAGDKVYDRQSQFKLVLGPMPLSQYLQYTPNKNKPSQHLLELIETVRSFIGFEYEWELQLLINRDSAPQVRLDESERLGWTTWMGWDNSNPSIDSTISGLTFKPEEYARQIREQNKPSFTYSN
jgi:type VI secretion system protein ImpH